MKYFGKNIKLKCEEQNCVKYEVNFSYTDYCNFRNSQASKVKSTHCAYQNDYYYPY